MSDLTNQIVYTALTRITDNRDIIKQAFQSWHSKFAGHEMDVFVFVDHIEQFLGLGTGEKKALMVSMHSSISKNQDHLKTVPDYILDSLDSNQGSATFSASKSDSAVKQSTEAKAVYIELAESYFNLMLTEAKRANGKQYSELLDILADEGLPQASKEVNVRLKSLADDQLSLPAATTEQACKDLCHDLYMLMCDVFGPMKSDDLSYKVVAGLLNSNEASRYDPRSLLE